MGECASYGTGESGRGPYKRRGELTFSNRVTRCERDVNGKA